MIILTHTIPDHIYMVCVAMVIIFSFIVIGGTLRAFVRLTRTDEEHD